jgi:hypothetical protein
MVIAMIAFVVHRWATGAKHTVDPQIVVAGAFVFLVVAMLDTGETEKIAKGFAWLFLAVAALNAIPDIHTAASATTTPAPVTLA